MFDSKSISFRSRSNQWYRPTQILPWQHVTTKVQAVLELLLQLEQREVEPVA
jgi:hypothetical protein